MTRLTPNETFIDRAADLLARISRWSPIGSPVALTIDDSGDERLIGITVSGRVRACDVGVDGTPTDLLVELDGQIAYKGHYVRQDISWLMTRPCLRWRRTNRMVLSWSAARIVDASSFRDGTYDRTIATGRVWLL